MTDKIDNIDDLPDWRHYRHQLAYIADTRIPFAGFPGLAFAAGFVAGVCHNASADPGRTSPLHGTNVPQLIAEDWDDWTEIVGVTLPSRQPPVDIVEQAFADGFASGYLRTNHAEIAAAHARAREERDTP